MLLSHSDPALDVKATGDVLSGDFRQVEEDHGGSCSAIPVPNVVRSGSEDETPMKDNNIEANIRTSTGKKLFIVCNITTASDDITELNPGLISALKNLKSICPVVTIQTKLSFPCSRSNFGPAKIF